MCVILNSSAREMSALISSKIGVLACRYTFSFAFTFWGGVTLQLSAFNLSLAVLYGHLSILDSGLLCSFACGLKGNLFDFMLLLILARDSL